MDSYAKTFDENTIISMTMHMLTKNYSILYNPIMHHNINNKIICHVVQ
jgi:hypothetical protein